MRYSDYRRKAPFRRDLAGDNRWRASGAYGERKITRVKEIAVVLGGEEGDAGNTERQS